MGFPRGMRRDRVALERRRMQAARLLEQGHSEAEVARRLGVHRQSVNRWAKALAAAGQSGLCRAARAGRPPKLSPADLEQLEQCLQQGPEQFGYLTGLWTLARVRKLIEQQHGVRSTPRRCGGSCASSTGAASDRPGVHASVMRKRSGIGNAGAGRSLKKKPCARSDHRLHR